MPAMASVHPIKTWATSQADEDGMNAGHAIFWRRLLELITERSLAGRRVLDFGCSQGGLLRMLHGSHGFAYGLGVDIAEESIAKARRLSTMIPARFELRRRLDGLEGQFDLALSHEVLYLLPDLDDHAAQIHACLRPGGAYYAAIGCHTDNPQWPAWQPVIQAMSNLAVQDRSLDDYARAFRRAGFEVYARPFQIDEFVPINLECGLMANVAAKLAYCTGVKTLFRLVKAA
jgi:SAM-dependent methyltransferase